MTAYGAEIDIVQTLVRDETTWPREIEQSAFAAVRKWWGKKKKGANAWPIVSGRVVPDTRGMYIALGKTRGHPRKYVCVRIHCRRVRAAETYRAIKYALRAVARVSAGILKRTTRGNKVDIARR